MSVDQLMTDLARLGIRIEADGDRLRYSPRSAVTPDLAQRMKVHKGDLLTILPSARSVEDKVDYWWSILTPEEREELKPRSIKLRCPWCKQIEHTAVCNELRPRRLMPLGKYKGHAIEDLPLDYVRWLAGAKVRLAPEIRDEIYDRFNVAIHND